jgi:hypothetical protein
MTRAPSLFHELMVVVLMILDCVLASKLIPLLFTVGERRKVLRG